MNKMNIAETLHFVVKYMSECFKIDRKDLSEPVLELAPMPVLVPMPMPVLVLSSDQPRGPQEQQ